MMRQMITRLLAVSGLLAAAPVGAQEGAVEYELRFPRAEQHQVSVTATFRGLAAHEPLALAMSRSSPGRYALHEFAKNVFDVRASDGQGRPLPVRRTSTNGWEVTGHGGTVQLAYAVWGDRIDGTYAGIDRSHAHLNVPAVFVWARGLEQAPIRLTVHPRPGWRTATQLLPTADPNVFTAPNLAWFMDSPLEVSPFSIRSWRTGQGADTTTWRLAVHHTEGEALVDSFAAMAQRVVQEEIAIWGAPPAYEGGTYTLIADYLPWASGDAMEHRNSAVLASRRSLASAADRVANLAPLAHELFHSWSMERLRPRSLEPFDLEAQNPSAELWFAEGFTSYYGHLVVRRAGYYSDAQYAAVIGEAINGVATAPGRGHLSAAEAGIVGPLTDGAVSLDPFNRQNLSVSYYTWGHALAIALDLELRSRYRLALDDFMRALWREFGRLQTPAFSPGRPYTNADLRRVLGEITRDPRFADEFFTRYVEGRELPDFEALVATAGLVLRRAAPDRPYLGAAVEDDPGAVYVNGPVENGSLFPAGITGGDLIHAVDGEPTPTVEALLAILARHRPGDVVQMEVSGRGARLTVPVALVANPSLEVVTRESASLPVTPAMRAVRDSWLGTRAGHR